MATRNIPQYDPRYTFESTAHVRMARVKFIGVPLRKMLHFLLPTWEDSATISLILERESAAAMIVAIALFLVLVRILLRSYGEKHVGIHSVRISQRICSAYRAFVNPLT